MALSSIAYIDKVDLVVNPNPDESKVVAADMNGIKTVVNAAVSVINTGIQALAEESVNGMFFSGFAGAINLATTSGVGISGDTGIDIATADELTISGEASVNIDATGVGANLLLNAQGDINAITATGELLAEGADVNISATDGDASFSSVGALDLQGDGISAIGTSIAYLGCTAGNVDIVANAGSIVAQPANQFVVSGAGSTSLQTTGGVNLNPPTGNVTLNPVNGTTNVNGSTVSISSTGQVTLDGFDNEIFSDGDFIIQQTNVGGTMEISAQGDFSITTTKSGVLVPLQFAGIVDLDAESVRIDTTQNVEITAANDLFLYTGGTVNFNSALTMANNQINGLAPATLDTDAPTFGQVKADIGGSDPTGAVTPDYIGQLFVDTIAKRAYIACGALAADWKRID